MSDISARSKDSPIVFVGTYTEPDASRSAGIYVYRMNPSSGGLTLETVKGVVNPSFLEIHPNQGFLYAVNESQSFAGQAGGGVSAFSINPVSNKLTLLNAQFSHGEDPCYLGLEQAGRFALAADYTRGSIAIFPIQQTAVQL